MNIESLIAFGIILIYMLTILYRLFYKKEEQKEKFKGRLLKYMSAEQAEEDYQKYYSRQKKSLYIGMLIVTIIIYKLIF